MTGRLREGTTRIVEVSDRDLEVIHRHGGLVWIDDASGDTTSGELVHHESFVIRCDAGITPRADDRSVRVRLRGQRRSAA